MYALSLSLSLSLSDEVWRNQGVGNEKLFLTEFKQRLISSYKQDWLNSIQSNQRYSFYSTFKSSLSLTPYLLQLKHLKARSFLIRLRLGVSPLRIHKFRFTQSTCDRRYDCPFCRFHTETEVHFILTCPRYQDIRESYIAKKYFTRPSSFKLALLLANTNCNVQTRLAIYVYKAFQMRNL